MGITRSVRYAAALAICGFLASPASVQTLYMSAVNGGKLHEICAQTVGQDAAYCSGYITAAMDTLVLKGTICRPYGATNAQAAAIVKAYIAERPADWHIHAAHLIEKALKPAFPCPK